MVESLISSFESDIFNTMKLLLSPTPSNLMCCFLFPVSGVRWSNINESIDNSSMGQVLLMLLVDTLIFALLAWYLDKVGSRRVTEQPGPTQGKRERGGVEQPTRTIITP